MGLDNKHLKLLLDMIESRFGKQLTLEDVQKLIKMETFDDCKQYMEVMLDFYFDVIMSPSGRKASSYIEDDRNLWLQTMFSKGCQFVSLLDGVGYSKGISHLNPIIDFSILFTIARSAYESLIVFELLFILPKTEEQQTIVYNLFMAHGLSERLKDLDEDVKRNNPKRVQEEQNDIDNCWKAIEDTELYSELDPQTKAKIKNAFGLRYRFAFKDDNTLKVVKYENAHAGKSWDSVNESLATAGYVPGKEADSAKEAIYDLMQDAHRKMILDPEDQHVSAAMVVDHGSAFWVFLSEKHGDDNY